MMMEEFEYYSLLRQLNEVQRLIFDDVLHIKQLFPNTPICLFLIGGARTRKKFTLKFIIQGLLQLHNRYISFDLIKTKFLLMASIGKDAFNIDGLTIHSALNIPIQQSLFSLPNLSSNSLNWFTCRYE
jgi:hypothetical protein